MKRIDVLANTSPSRVSEKEQITPALQSLRKFPGNKHCRYMTSSTQRNKRSPEILSANQNRNLSAQAESDSSPAQQSRHQQIDRRAHVNISRNV